jgi:hypothetical protein
MALALNKIIVSNVLTNSAASYFQTTTVSSVGSGNATTMTNAQFIPAGMYLLPPTANVVIEVNTGASNVNAWSTLIANNTGGVLFSDGWNVRANATTGTQTVTLYTVSGGVNATGQYNS